MVLDCGAATQAIPINLMRKLLITGAPGVGKTTLITKLAIGLERYKPVGFYTTEIREGGTRRGFEFVDLDGNRGILAHVDLMSDVRVGRYGVDVPGFESFLRSIPFEDRAGAPVIVDEIGRMECASDAFRALIGELMTSGRLLVATIAKRGGGLVAKIKDDPSIELIDITRANRDSTASDLLIKLSAALNGRGQ